MGSSAWAVTIATVLLVFVITVCHGSSDCVFGIRQLRNGDEYRNESATCLCFNGTLRCFKSCVNNKPGFCPRSVKETYGVNDTCTNEADECLSDQGCSGDKKCCYNGCNNICVLPPGCIFRGKHYDANSEFVTYFDMAHHTCKCEDHKVDCDNEQPKFRKQKPRYPTFPFRSGA